ncbi:arginine-ornithine antiporter [Peribacillus kribbensis]|uniref:arginine-ornithine antiporter n=1 Tax=Peribacillus kribbensis TaxID=356658 RepID=UPI00047AAF51
MQARGKLGLLPLVALVIGSVIGGGAFNLPSDITQGAGTGAILIGWLITGIGILALGLSFQNLNNRRPDLDGGIFSYAKAGFGQYIGFNSAWGYWCSAFLGNVAFATLLINAAGYFYPKFTGKNVSSIVAASIVLWAVHILVLQGVKSASIVNMITTAAKLIPILLFIVITIFAFDPAVFKTQFWGTADFSLGDVFPQVKSTMLITLWVFLGFEGAVLLSGRAAYRRDVGRATVIGLISTLAIYVLISVASLGVLDAAELSKLKNPSLAYVLEAVTGKWGASLVNIGLIVSLLGAWLGWTIVTAEIPYAAAKEKLFPNFFLKENKNQAPSRSLLVSNLLVQIFLLTFLFSEKPYQLAFSLASSAILLPYLFSALYQIKHSWQHKSKNRIWNLLLGIIAAAYSVWLIYAGGLGYLLLTILLYLPGMLIYSAAQKQKQQKLFKGYEPWVAATILVVSVVAIIMLIRGEISI